MSKNIVTAVDCIREMMKSVDEWSWKVCLGLILANREGEGWNWFSMLVGMLY